jgi:hypothetical protein
MQRMLDHDDQFSIAASGAFERATDPQSAYPYVADLLESECEAHCICPPPGAA